MPVTVEQLTDTAKSMLAQEGRVNELIEKLKREKENLRVIREETLPNMMHENGASEFKLTNGMKITVKQEVYASIPKAKKVEAFAWLNDNGHGGLIKTGVLISYPKGERDDAIKKCVDLNNDGLKAEFDENVNTGTLKAFIKEQLRDGKNVPMDLFGAHPVMTASIK